MADIVWEDPQDNRLGGPEYEEKAEQLKQRPGHWGRVAEGLDKSRTQASSTALAIRRGSYRAFQPKGSFEARSSGAVVWARFVGENQEYAGVTSDSESPVNA